jgi:hypothetical protein
MQATTQLCDPISFKNIREQLSRDTETFVQKLKWSETNLFAVTLFIISRPPRHNAITVPTTRVQEQNAFSSCFILQGHSCQRMRMHQYTFLGVG